MKRNRYIFFATFPLYVSFFLAHFEYAGAKLSDLAFNQNRRNLFAGVMGNVLNQLMSTFTTAMEHEMQVVVETCG